MTLSKFQSARGRAGPMQQAARANDTGYQTLRVLIIDDNPDDRNMIRHALLRSDECRYIVTEADTGAKGLALCAAAGPAPDCVIVDLYLPDLSGLEVIEALSNGTAELPFPVILLTGSEHERRDARHALALGAQDYLEKSGITGQSLNRSVANAIERFRLAQRINENEHRLRLALEVSATGMWDWDMRTNAVHWSPECYTIHGLRDDEFDGTAASFDKLLHPEDRARVWAAVRAAADQHARYECEFRIVRPNGEVRWVASLGQAMYDADRQPLRMVGTLTDITARKRAEEALRVSEAAARQRREELERAMEAMPAAVLIARDAACTDMYGNRTAREMMQIPALRTVQGVAELDVPRHEFWSYGRRLPAQDWPIRRAAATGEAVSQSVWEVRRPDGRTVDILGNVLPLFDDAGGVARRRRGIHGCHRGTAPGREPHFSRGSAKAAGALQRVVGHHADRD